MENTQIKSVKEQKGEDKNRYEITFEDEKTITLEGNGELKVAIKA